jgi:hypothetical protein
MLEGRDTRGRVPAEDETREVDPTESGIRRVTRVSSSGNHGDFLGFDLAVWLTIAIVVYALIEGGR